MPFHDDEWLMEFSLSVRWPTGQSDAFYELREAVRSRVRQRFGADAGASVQYVPRHREFTFETRTPVRIEAPDGKRTAGALVAKHSVRTFEPLKDQFRAIDALLQEFVATPKHTRKGGTEG